jgi:enamine deaminase RidA (YjgF/YER057c/UK114 family)
MGDMSEAIKDRLKGLGLQLPKAAIPAANYVSFAMTGNLLLTAGQLPFSDGKLISTGHLGRDLDVEDGQKAARQCAINILSQAEAALGDLERITRIIKITAFVASAPDFVSQHLVANGASDLLVAVLGERGKHARSAVGNACLPLNAPVEIEAIIEFE